MAQLAAQVAKLGLLFGRERGKELGDALRVCGEYPFYEFTPFICEMHGAEAAVCLASLSADKSSFFQIIHNGCHVPAGFQQLLGERALAERTFVQQCFQHAELADGEVVSAKVRMRARCYGICGTGQLYVGCESLSRLGHCMASLVNCRII
jgi:hypothetical protein